MPTTLEFKLEKIIGIEKHAGKVRKSKFIGKKFSLCVMLKVRQSQNDFFNPTFLPKLLYYYET